MSINFIPTFQINASHHPLHTQNVDRVKKKSPWAVNKVGTFNMFSFELSLWLIILLPKGTEDLHQSVLPQLSISPQQHTHTNEEEKKNNKFGEYLLKGAYILRDGKMFTFFCRMEISKSCYQCMWEQFFNVSEVNKKEYNWVAKWDETFWNGFGMVTSKHSIEFLAETNEQTMPMCNMESIINKEEHTPRNKLSTLIR